MLTPKLSLVSIAEDATSKTFKDSTGAYSTNNPGGYGTPNPASTDITAIYLRVALYSDLNTYYNYLIPDFSDLFTDAGIKFSATPFGIGNGDVFPDAVYDYKYLVGFAGTGQISWTGGSKQFTLTNADTVLAGIAAFTLAGDTEKIYYIDQTKALTSSGGYVVTALPNSGSPKNFTKFYESDLKVLVKQTGANCLAEDIGIWSEKDCQDDNFRDIWDRYKMEVALTNKFAKGYFYDAHNLAVKLASYCTGSSLSNYCSCS